MLAGILYTVPAVKNNAADSPITRPIESITPESIPGIALGSITLYKVWNLVAPSPSDASLYDGGTTFKDSSVVLIITGKIIIERVNDPAKSE